MDLLCYYSCFWSVRPGLDGIISLGSTLVTTSSACFYYCLTLSVTCGLVFLAVSSRMVPLIPWRWSPESVGDCLNWCSWDSFIWEIIRGSFLDRPLSYLAFSS